MPFVSSNLPGAGPIFPDGTFESRPYRPEPDSCHHGPPFKCTESTTKNNNNNNTTTTTTNNNNNMNNNNNNKLWNADLRGLEQILGFARRTFPRHADRGGF